VIYNRGTDRSSGFGFVTMSTVEEAEKAVVLYNCYVVEVSTSKTGKRGHAKCHFIEFDIFTGKKLEDIVPSSYNCDVIYNKETDRSRGFRFVMMSTVEKAKKAVVLYNCYLLNH
ncbi:28 kDa ribonucleoprotein, chloroplastic-like, partial [Capsicum annuum]|uniref:28 kDa ribonucleoprotein, chloroplastic-like n=1 Tax=Capsicum annuum TaxID=4072 RepID=UPI001FB15751